jgi:hemerythrin-like metal-binding protein
MSSNLDRYVVFPWDINFETGIAKIDEQHHALVDLLNKLANCLINSDAKEIGSTFNELADYAEMHFREEEDIWYEHFKDDSWHSSHQISHASFLPAIVDIKEQSDSTSLSEVIEQIVKFLIRWLAFHIIDNDMRMAIAVKALESGSLLEDAKLIADKKMAGSMRILIETILRMYDGLSSRTIDLMRERSARTEAEAELIESNMELKTVLEEIKTLRGIIPICSYCHSIRDDSGAWSMLESYISKHSEAQFSHGVCPKCLEKTLAENDLDEK